MICRLCGASNSDGQKFCGGCGTRLAQPCGVCGRENLPGENFCGECGSVLAKPQLGDALLPNAERREVTVMFCDLVGSTAIGSHIDPEAFRQILAEYHGCISSTVAKFEAFVAHRLGDGAVVYFGWPTAHEACAERAVRAGLAVIDAIGRAPMIGEALQVRIGIATGLVVAGEFPLRGISPEHEIVGDTPHLAARLQALAEPGTLVVSQETRRQIGEVFSCRDLGEFAIKGFDFPIRAWQIWGESKVRSRFEAMHSAPLPPMVGRDEELELLLRRWKQAGAGEGRVVWISGEAGIGKSRLVQAMTERLRDEIYFRLRYFCSQHSQDTVLHPVVAQLRHAAKLGIDAREDKKLAKLEILLSPSAPSDEEIALFADLLSISLPQQLSALQLSPQRKKEKILGALIGQLERLAADRPVLIILEDAHWADPTTRELLELVAHRVEALPILLIATSRPEFHVPWIDRVGVTLMTLSRVGRRQAIAIAAQVAGAAALNHELLDRIVVQAEGIPLFIEELTKSVVERTSASPTAQPIVSIPQTLQASLMARLDRLPGAKFVAQCGAVIGREFPYQLLAAVVQQPESNLLQALDQLVSSGLVFRLDESPDARYLFKHALVQDAAYESLLRASRSAIHSRTVQAIHKVIPHADDACPELLGYHCAQAGLIEQAVRHYTRAGELSITRSAMQEARAHLEQGASLVRSLPDGGTRYGLEAELLLALETVGIVTHGYGDEETGSTSERAVTLARRAGQDKLLIRALFGEWAYRSHVGDLSGSSNVAQEMVALAERQADPFIWREASISLGMNYFFSGRFVKAREIFESCLAKLESEKALVLEGLHPQDAEVHARCFLALQLACLGHFEQSALETAKGIQRARKLLHMPSLAVALTVGCRQAWLTRNEDLLADRSAELVELCREQRFPYWLARGYCFAGWVAVQRGQFSYGISLLNDALSTLRASGVALWNINGLVGEAYARAGDSQNALRHIDTALQVSSQTGEVWGDAELHRIKGEILLAPPFGGKAVAEENLVQAIDIARSQAAKLWELRASTSLARHWSAVGKGAAAHALLEPILHSIEAHADIPDLSDAKHVLALVR
jgi:class 3 adenylate cyclase/tetratricopeptide (TPR) repeat protein